MRTPCHKIALCWHGHVLLEYCRGDQAWWASWGLKLEEFAAVRNSKWRQKNYLWVTVSLPYDKASLLLFILLIASEESHRTRKEPLVSHCIVIMPITLWLGNIACDLIVQISFVIPHTYISLSWSCKVTTTHMYWQGGVWSTRCRDQSCQPRTGPFLHNSTISPLHYYPARPEFRVIYTHTWSFNTCFCVQGMPDFAPPQHLLDALSECTQEAMNNQYTRSQVCAVTACDRSSEHTNCLPMSAGPSTISESSG